MKLLLASLILVLLVASPVSAQEGDPTFEPHPEPTPQVQGLYDEEIDSTESATVTPEPTATPSARTTEYLDPSDAPVSGTFETTLMILAGGITFILLGFRLSKG
jgi:hypothetical protein